MPVTVNNINNRINRLYALSDEILHDIQKGAALDLVKTYQNSLANIKDRLESMYSRYGDEITISEALRYGRLRSLESEIFKINKLMGKECKKRIAENILENYEKSYNYSSYAIQTPSGLDAAFVGLKPEIIKASLEYPYDRIKWPDRLAAHVSAMNQHVMETVTEGLIQGYGYTKTAQLIKDRTEHFRHQATRISWTESTRARSEARNLAFDESKKAAKELGYYGEVSHIWDATLDGVTRPSHGRLDQKPADENGEWHVSHEGIMITTKGAGQSGVASFDIHCRCTSYTQVGDIKPSYRLDNEKKEAIPYTDYEEWSKNKGIKPDDRAIKKFTQKTVEKPIPEKFQPAKTELEATRRLEKFTKPNVERDIAFYEKYLTSTQALEFKQGVRLPGLKKDKLNSILNAFEDVMGKNVRVNAIGFQQKRRKSLACYSYSYDGNREALLFQKTATKANPLKLQKEGRENFKRSKEYRLKNFEIANERLQKPGVYNAEQAIRTNEIKMETLKETTRWITGYEEGVDYLYATAVHEAAHAQYYNSNVKAILQGLIKEDKKVAALFNNAHLISEYAKTNMSEFWSELPAAVKTDTAPKDFVDLYNRVLKDIKYTQQGSAK